MNNDPNAEQVVDPTNANNVRAADPQGDAEANKRAALAGQWRTPPMPTYPSGYTTAPIPAGAPPPQRRLEYDDLGGGLDENEERSSEEASSFFFATVGSPLFQTKDF